MRFRDDNPADLARARTAVMAWRDQNPAGMGDELVATVGRQFHRTTASYSVPCCSPSTGTGHAR